MAKAKNGDTVKIHYTGKMEDGRVFDSSADHEPLQFRIGKGVVIPGIEDALVGMNQGETKTVNIPPEKAYGPYRDEMVVEVEKSKIPPQITPEVGQKLKIQQPDGRTFIVTVTDISDTRVTMDANHPLAGKDLIYDIQLVEIV